MALFPDFFKAALDYPYGPRYLALVDIKKENRIISDMPAGRIGEPEDTIGAAIFLASRASDYMTGKYLQVNGGLNVGDMAWPPSPDQQG